jgi:hypothetical protein
VTPEQREALNRINKESRVGAVGVTIERNRLQARVAELEEALRPFAHLAGRRAFTDMGNSHAIHDDLEGHRITLGDCRKARDVLKG